jgi:hypothetical protein
MRPKISDGGGAKHFRPRISMHIAAVVSNMPKLPCLSAFKLLKTAVFMFSNQNDDRPVHLKTSLIYASNVIKMQSPFSQTVS